MPAPADMAFSIKQGNSFVFGRSSKHFRVENVRLLYLVLQRDTFFIYLVRFVYSLGALVSLQEEVYTWGAFHSSWHHGAGTWIHSYLPLS